MQIQSDYAAIVPCVIESNPRGRRAGRPPRRAPAAVEKIVERAKTSIDAEGVPAYTLEEIAEEINALPCPPPRPKPHEGEPWTASAVRSIFPAIRRPRLTLLMRMGSLLEALERHGPAPVSDVLDLCQRHQVNIYWLWDRYQLPWIEPDSQMLEPFAPVVDLDWKQATATISSGGRGVLGLYEQADRYPHELQDVLAQLIVGPPPVSSKSVRRLCRWFGTSFERLISSRLVRVTEGGHYEPTQEGETVGNQWNWIAWNIEEQGRWDWEFLPDPDEERLLGPGWDWDDRPPLPA